MEDRVELRSRVESLRRLLSDDSLVLLPDFKARLSVLRQLHYADESSVLRKGRVACEVCSLNDCPSGMLFLFRIFTWTSYVSLWLLFWLCS